MPHRVVHAWPNANIDSQYPFLLLWRSSDRGAADANIFRTISGHTDLLASGWCMRARAQDACVCVIAEARARGRRLCVCEEGGGGGGVIARASLRQHVLTTTRCGPPGLPPHALYMQWSSAAVLAINHINTRNSSIVGAETMSRIPSNFKVPLPHARTQNETRAHLQSDVCL